MPTVNPRRARRTTASVHARRALRIVLIIAAIAAVLLAAWWALSYVNKANVAVPVAHTPTSRPLAAAVLADF
jgi:ferric-dicitrate binding protein FerR (iron transport regulator)